MTSLAYLLPASERPARFFCGLSRWTGEYRLRRINHLHFTRKNLIGYRKRFLAELRLTADLLMPLQFLGTSQVSGPQLFNGNLLSTRAVHPFLVGKLDVSKPKAQKSTSEYYY